MNSKTLYALASRLLDDARHLHERDVQYTNDNQWLAALAVSENLEDVGAYMTMLAELAGTTRTSLVEAVKAYRADLAKITPDMILFGEAEEPDFDAYIERPGKPDYNPPLVDM